MNAKEYATVEQFVMNVRFRDYVLNPKSKHREYWESYLKYHPEKILLIREAKQMVLWLDRNRKESLSLELSESEVLGLWDKIHQKATDKAASKHSELPIPKKTGPFPILRYGIAASIVLLFGFGWWISTQDKELMLSVQEQDVAWVTNTNAPGTKSSIRLSDGSKITLNAGSEVRYKNQFDSESREIFLSGEAFFEVAKDSLRPFIVHTGDFSTQALGTSFNIRSFEGKNTQVSLVTGIIQVSDRRLHAEKILQPGEGVILADEIGPIRQIDIQKAISWTQKIISLDQADFEEVLNELSNWFGVEFHLENVPRSIPSTTASYQDESLENILLGLSYKLDFSYEIHGKEIFIDFSKK